MPPASALCRASTSIRATLPDFLTAPSRFPPRISGPSDLSIINQRSTLGDGSCNWQASKADDRTDSGYENQVSAVVATIESRIGSMNQLITFTTYRPGEVSEISGRVPSARTREFRASPSDSDRILRQPQMPPAAWIPIGSKTSLRFHHGTQRSFPAIDGTCQHAPPRSTAVHRSSPYAASRLLTAAKT